VKLGRSQKRCPKCSDQCFCGSSQRLEDNHIGGRKHAPSIWLPFCGAHHDDFHRNCERVGVQFGRIENRTLALIQAMKAMLIGIWMVVDWMEKQVRADMEKLNDG
jgi:hypothetical protein